MDLEDAVKNSFIFSTLEAEELLAVLNITREKKFPKGAIIMQEGNEGDEMYIVVEGEIGVSKSLTMKFGDDDFRQTEKVLTRLQPKDNAIFGEMALIARENRSASITALTDCILLEIKRDAFMRLLEGKPSLGIKILIKLAELLAGRLRRSSDDVIRLTTALSIALSK